MNMRSLLFHVLLLTSTVITLLPAEVWAQKSLYITIRRDFSPLEDPQVEINYRNTAPITLRILKPTDLSAFVASQIDLRRAWREPTWALNPAHFLLQGLNRAQLDSGWLRRGMDPKLIDEARTANEDLQGTHLPTTPASEWRPGPERLLQPPAGFEIAKTVTVRPEVEDGQREFSVPGFDSWGSGGLQTKLVDLPKMPPGFYIIQMLQEDTEGQSVLVVNDLMAQLQQSVGQGLVRVADRSGRPVVGAKVRLRSLQGRWIHEGVTNERGVIDVAGLDTSELVTVVEAKDRGVAIIDSEFFSTNAVFPDVYLYTDRPMLRPGESVQFRGIHRLRQPPPGGSGKSEIDKRTRAETARVWLENVQSGEVINPVEAKITEFATFSGQLTVPAGAPEGVYRVVASVNRQDFSADLRIKDYIKPKYFITISSNQDSLQAGDVLKASAKTELYAGGPPPAGSKMTAQLFRVRLSAPQWADDAGLGETGSAVNYRDETSASILPFLVAEEADISVSPKGETDVQLTLPAKLPGPDGFDYQFQLRLTFQDPDSFFASASRTFADAIADVTAQARFSTPLALKSGVASLKLRSVSPLGVTRPQIEGTVRFWLTGPDGRRRDVKTMDFKTDAQGLATLTPPLEKNGLLEAEVIMRDKAGRSSRAMAEMIVASQGLAMGVTPVAEPRVLTASSTVSPGQTAQVLLLLPADWGLKGSTSGLIHITVAGTRIFSSDAVSVRGTAQTFDVPIRSEMGTAVTVSLAWPSPAAGWVERRSLFQIIDPQTRLQISAQTERPLVLPGGRQALNLELKDSQGRPVSGEIGVSVVDRAVLDLQPEIRPRLLDFFYPLDRLNLMTFVSTEFQGYGYAERLAHLFRANHKLAATKSATESLNERDTAYWSGSVRTDAQGKARVEFQVPANQTIWRVITVAADREGRFGEGQIEFKAQLPVSMLVGFPSVLRQGDETFLRTRIAPQESTLNETISARLTVSPPVDVLLGGKSEPTLVAGSVGKGQLINEQLQLKIAEDATPRNSRILSQLEIQGTSLAFENRLDILSSRFVDRQTHFPSDRAGSRILAQAEPGDRLINAKLVVSSGLFSTALPTLRWLSEYPFSCLEQTLSAIAGARAVQGLFDGFTPADLTLEDRDLLTRSTRTLSSASNKLRQYQTNANGVEGYSWFAQAGQPDLRMTILAAVISSLSGQADLIDGSIVQSLVGQLADLNSTTGLLVTRYQIEANRWSAERFFGQIQLQVKWVEQSGTLFDKAMLLSILNVLGSGWGQEPEWSQKTAASLRDELLGKLRPWSQSLSFRVEGSSGLLPTDRSAWPGRSAAGFSLIARSVFDRFTIEEKRQEKRDRSSVSILPAWYVPFVRRALLQTFDGEQFGSTLESSMVLINSAWLMKMELNELSARRGSTPVSALSVSVNGRTQSLRASPVHIGRLEVEVPVQANEAELRLEILTPLPGLMSQLVVSHERDIKRVQTARDGSFRIERAYYQMGQGGLKTRLESPMSVRLGDRVYVELRVTALTPVQGPNESRYSLIRDSLPAGFEVLDEDREFQAAPWDLALIVPKLVRELGRTQARWYADWNLLPRGRELVFGYIMRATSAGRFSAGLAQVEDFYNEDLTSHSAPATLVVESISPQ
jgi:hypothetical protein